MKRHLSLLSVPLALALLAPAGRAQEMDPPTPTHVVVRFFKCNPQGVGIRALQQGRPVADSMVAEGKFVSYGILAHSWGDEWNVVDYFNVSGLDGFFSSFSELVRRAGAAQQASQEMAGEMAEDDGPTFGEACTEHKDVIYAVVQPPTGG